jgi:transcriptional repressor NrdR
MTRPSLGLPGTTNFRKRVSVVYKQAPGIRSRRFFFETESAMRCPFCGSENSQVKDSRPSDENSAIRRRRVCSDCGGRFTTFERVQLRDLTVIKRSGRKVPFDRDKLARSVSVAMRKRPIEPERIDRLVSGLVRQIESSGESEISSAEIGELVMAALRELDPVAYVRFASVYRDFRDAADFQAVLRDLASDVVERRKGSPSIDTEEFEPGKK